VSKQAKSPSGKNARTGLSDKTKLTLIVLASSALVLGGGIWAYYEFTTMPPPDIESASPQEVATFFGSTRGLSRMPVDKRQEYLGKIYMRFSRGADRDQFHRSLRRMSRSEREVFLDATFDIVRVRVVENAEQYKKIRSKKERTKFIDSALINIQNMQAEIGGGSPMNDLSSPFQKDLPKSTDEWMKIAYSRTNAAERALAKPFLEDVATRIQERNEAQGRH